MSAGLTVVLAAYRWPGPDELGALRRTLTRAHPGETSVIEAREREDGAVGAAALVNAAARDVSHGRLLIARPDCQWSPDPLGEALATLTDEVALLELADESTPAPPPTAGRSPWTWPPASGPAPAALIVPAYRFRELGGLDEALWSIGELEDFGARALVLGSAVTRVVVPGRRVPPAPFPLATHLRTFLTIRNRLRTAFKTLPAEWLGPDLAVAAASAMAASADAAGFDRALLEDGRSWPRSGRRPPPAATRRRVWPRDEAGTLVPLLALDSFVTDMAALTPAREDLQRRRIDRHAPCGPDRHPPADLLEAIVTAGASSLAGDTART